MNIKQALKHGQEKLENKSTTPLLDAEVLLSFVIKKQKEFFYSHGEKNITTRQETKFKDLIKRRSKSQPIAYLVGYKEFYNIEFKVDSRVLIPRPETEVIIDEILKLNPKKSTIADIGTGSGCIAITLKKLIPQAKIIATDISKPALQIAKKNAKLHKVKIDFIAGNLLDPVKSEKIDIIVANLPYGWAEWKNNTTAETKSLKFEPSTALFTTKKGLYLYEILFKQASELKNKPKLIIAEFDPRQKNDIKAIIDRYLPKAKTQIKKDLAGHNRIVIVRL